jgi:succinate dehydrogenase / fumarate reductase flavoprotein subunit
MIPYRTFISNILVIGSGAAGLRSAIAAYQAGSEVLVVGKRLRKDAHTVLAAGGINAAYGNVDPQDSWQQHFADTMVEAYHLANPQMVMNMVREAPAAVIELAEWGCDFALTSEGKIDQRYFGAHTYRRTCYAGDYTGREIMNTLDARATTLGVPIHENIYITRLLVADETCFGAMGFDILSGERRVYLADAVVLAAGGHTRLWRRSSSRRDENTGDGMYLALQAGAELADMELVQFHPSGMAAPEEWAGTLVTEAVRGEGGILRNKDGERFMQRYDPQRMELSTRDRVALAVYTEIMEGRGTPNGGVYLDISHRSKEYILQKLPRMYRQMMEAQMLDISLHPMEVAPTAHYSMGGVVVDPDTTATAVKGLFAAGEVTSGLHGANRLGGNSLTETLVFGRRAGEHAASFSQGLTRPLRSPDAIQQANAEIAVMIKPGDELVRPLQRALRNTMWEYCGVVRSQERLAKGQEKIDELKQSLPMVDVRPSSEGYKDLAIAYDLKASLTIAEATILSAIERRESRGAHQRSDYPNLDPRLQLNLCVNSDASGALQVTHRQIPPVPQELVPWLSEETNLALKGRLLE